MNLLLQSPKHGFVIVAPHPTTSCKLITRFFFFCPVRYSQNNLIPHGNSRPSFSRLKLLRPQNKATFPFPVACHYKDSKKQSKTQALGGWSNRRSPSFSAQCILTHGKSLANSSPACVGGIKTQPSPSAVESRQRGLIGLHLEILAGWEVGKCLTRLPAFFPLERAQLPP